MQQNNYQQYLNVKLNDVNNKAAYVDILSYLIEYNNLNEAIAYVQTKLQHWNKEYQLPLYTLIPKLTEIKSIIDGRPSKLAFRALVSKLDTWKDKGEEYVYAIGESKILSWPAKYRYAPWSWCAGLKDDEPKRFWNWVKYRGQHPYFFFNDCYTSLQANTLVNLPALAEERLELFPNIIPIQVNSEIEFGTDELWLYNTHSIFYSGLEWDRKDKFIKIVSNNKYKNITKLYIKNLPYKTPHKSAEFIIEVLINTGYFERLKVFKLEGSSNAMSLKAIELLVSNNLPYLEELSLSFSLCDNKNSQQYIQTLSQAKFPALRKIDLSGAYLNDEGISYLINNPWFSGLEEIKLSCNNITDVGMRYLADANINLKSIDLTDNDFNIEGFNYLINSKASSNLWSLNIHRNDYETSKNQNLDHELIVQAISSSNLNQLIELIVYEDYDDKISHLFSAETVKKVTDSKVFSLLDSFLIGYIDWTDACDGHGPYPWACFTDKNIDVLQHSSIFRSCVKNELVLLHKLGNDYQNDD